MFCRAPYVQFLPVMTTDNSALFIKKKHVEVTNWVIFSTPFSGDIWLSLLFSALVMATWLHLANVAKPSTVKKKKNIQELNSPININIFRNIKDVWILVAGYG